MTYAEIKRNVLSLINQYSIAGSEIASSYNNQDDYLKRIPGLFNMGLVNIRTSVKMSPAVKELNHPTFYAGMIRFNLPGDFYALKSGGTAIVHDGVYRKAAVYKLQGRKFILFPKYYGYENDKFVVEYYRYPEQLPADPDDDYELDEDLDVLHTAFFYAAANLVMYDDNYQYASLYNDYESRLGRLAEPPSCDLGPVEDVYCFTDGGY